ncbi:unnamed protein product [Urochloa humidicola]
MADVENVLNAWEFAIAADQEAPAATLLSAATPQADEHTLAGLTGPAVPGPCDDLGQDGLEAGETWAHMEDFDPLAVQAGPVATNGAMAAASEGDTAHQVVGPDVATAGESMAQAGHLCAAQLGGNTPAPQPLAVDDLFTTPDPPLLQNRPVRAPRQRRVFDMTAIRRSARLANRPPMPSMQRAQQNLRRKLGLQVDELTPIEDVLKEYVKSVTGPLPDYIIAALATLLDLDDECKDQMTEALLQHAGDGVAELQAEQDTLLQRYA